MARRRGMGRNSVSDFQEGLTLVRSLTGTNTSDTNTARAVTIDPGGLQTSNFTASYPCDDYRQTGAFITNGARTVKMRVFSTSNTATVQIQLKEFPYEGPRNKLQATERTRNMTQGKGTLIADLTFTTSGSSTVNTNPVTGAAEAGVTYYEAGVFSTTYSQASRINQYPAATTTNEMFITVDCLGAAALFPQIAASTNITNGTILIAMQAVD